MAERRTYSPGGAAHRMLARAAEGPATAADLRQAAAPPGPKARQMWRVVQALREDGLALRDAAGAFVLTHRGEHALDVLRAGRPVGFDPHG